MKHATLTVLLAIAAIALPAQADETYVGANLVQVHYQELGFDTAKPFATVGRIGRQFGAHLAIEGRLGFGLTKDTVDVFGTPVDIEVEHIFGVYARGILPITPQLAVYGLLGYTDAELTATGPGGSISVSDSDVSFGIGADVGVMSVLAFNLEYAKLFSETNYDIYGWSLGVKLSF